MADRPMGLMGVRLLVGLIVVTVAIGAIPGRVLSCSGGPVGGPPAAVRSASVVVVGRVIGLEVEGGDRERVYARVSIQVDRFLKGSAPNPVSYVDDRSVFRGLREGELFFGGSGGACGTLDYDPTGKYVLALLHRNPDGSYATVRPLVSFADTPSGLRRSLEIFGLSAELPTLPATGGGELNSPGHGRTR